MCNSNHCRPSDSGPAFLVHGIAVLLVLALSGCKFPTLTSIAVTPAAPSTTTLTSTQQFTAIGTFSNNSKRDITSSVTWASATTAVATIDEAGLATAVGGGSTTITASYKGVNGSTTFAVTPGLLTWGQANWNTVYWQ